MFQSNVTNYPMQQYNSNVELKIIPKSSSLFIDDYIEGQIELTTPIQIIINEINLALYSSQKWQNILDQINTEEKSEPIVSSNLNVKKKLNINSDLAVLKSGKYQFGFKFRAQNIINPTFEYWGNENNAYLRYILFANIISPYIKGNTFIYLLFKQKQHIEANINLSTTLEKNIHKWGLFDGGKPKLNATILNSTNNFKFGEDIKLNINIDNSNGKIDIVECNITLVRNILLKDKIGQIKYLINDEILTQTIKTDTKQGEVKSFPATLSLKNFKNSNLENMAKMIPYNNYDNIYSFLPSIRTMLIGCSYLIQFSLNFDSFVTDRDRFKAFLEIILCHQSLDEYKIEMQRKVNIFNNIPNINNNQYQNIIPHYNMMPPNNMKPIMNNNNEIPNTPLSNKVINRPINNLQNQNNSRQINQINNNGDVITNFEDKDYNDYMNNEIKTNFEEEKDKNNININNKNVKTNFEDKSYNDYMNNKSQNANTDLGKNNFYNINESNNYINSKNNMESSINSNDNQIINEVNEGNEGNAPPLPIKNGEQVNQQEQNSDNK